MIDPNDSHRSRNGTTAAPEVTSTSPDGNNDGRMLMIVILLIVGAFLIGVTMLMVAMISDWQ